MTKRLNTEVGLLFVLLAMLLPQAAFAEIIQDEIFLELPSSQDIEIPRFVGGNKTLLLWIPSQRGVRPGHKEQATALAEAGFEVWVPDLHGTYFIPRTRSSIEKFPIDDVAAIIDAAVEQAGDRQVVMISTSRGAQLTLIGAREWQLNNPGKSGIAGIVLMHPYLYLERPDVGQRADFLPIVDATNLPVYLLEAQFSTKMPHIKSLAERLTAAGSPVYTQVIKGTQGGFFMRKTEDLTPIDLREKLAFPKTIGRISSMLKFSKAPSAAVVTTDNTRQLTRYKSRATSLTPVSNPYPAPTLTLSEYRGGSFNLAANTGKVQLINFWASWCSPCVEEIPSLHRLRAKIPDEDFEIITVNVGEDKKRIDKFMEKVGIDLPLLLDLESQSARDWQVYVYPSNYLVDRSGNVRFAYLGALEWDSQENIEVIESVLSD